MSLVIARGRPLMSARAHHRSAHPMPTKKQDRLARPSGRQGVQGPDLADAQAAVADAYPDHGLGFSQISSGRRRGYSRRAHENLKMIFPDMSAQERKRIVRASLDNVGRTNHRELLARGSASRCRGPAAQGPGLARHRGRAARQAADHLRLGAFRQLAGRARGAEPARLRHRRPLPAVQQPLRQCPLRGVHRTGRRAGLCPVAPRDRSLPAHAPGRRSGRDDARPVRGAGRAPRFPRPARADIAVGRGNGAQA